MPMNGLENVHARPSEEFNCKVYAFPPGGTVFAAV